MLQQFGKGIADTFFDQVGNMVPVDEGQVSHVLELYFLRKVFIKIYHDAFQPVGLNDVVSQGVLPVVAQKEELGREVELKVIYQRAEQHLFVFGITIVGTCGKGHGVASGVFAYCCQMKGEEPFQRIDYLVEIHSGSIPVEVVI